MKRSKYNSKKTEYDGFMYDSKKEANYARKLDLFIKAGDLIEYDRQVKMHYEVGIKTRTDDDYTDHKTYFYRCDFVEYWANGTTVYTDVKGFRTPEYKRKKKIIEKLYDIKLNEV